MSSDRRRYLALWLPYLTTDRLRRRHPTGYGAAPDKRPLVVTVRTCGALRLSACDRAAAALGIHPGMTLADARARVPDLAVEEADESADHALIEGIADWCDRFTPLVGVDGGDGLMLDITGCAHLFGGEAAMRREIIRRLDRFGFASCATIAGTPDAARALARFGKISLVMAGADAVRPLPIAALGLSPDLVLMLSRAGLKTIADLADRPRAPLAARFGRELVTALDRVLGVDEAPISPRRPVPAFLAEQSFAEPIALHDAILAVISSLAGKIATLLERHGKGGRRFEAVFFRTDGALARIAVQSGRPLRDPELLARLFRERMDALRDPLDPGFGFDMIRLAVLSAEDFGQVQRSLDGAEKDRAATEDLLDRLSARFGASRVLRMVPGDSHVPERAASLVPAISAAAGTGDWLPNEPGIPPARPLRMFDPPEPVETIAEVPDGPPLRFRWRRVMHDVVAAEGPERIAPEWWRGEEAGLTRDYFRIEDETGHRFWLYREGLYDREDGRPRWYLHGLFA